MSAASFDGLSASSCDAYRPEKWSSNVFTRERLEVKQRLLLLARALEPSFERFELKLQRYASDEYPSLRNGKKVDAQWVFFWRTEEERLVLEREVDLEKTLAATLADPTPMTRHAFLCLRIDEEGLELGFRLHRDAWVDQHNLVNKIKDPDHRSTFVGLINDLPPQIVLEAGQGQSIGSDQRSEQAILDLIEKHSKESSGDGFLRVSLKIGKEKLEELEAGLVEHLEPNLASIAHVYRFVAWSEENDQVSTDEEFLRSRAQRGERRQKLEDGAAKRKEALEAKKKEAEAARKELEELFRREAVARASAPKRPRPEKVEDKAGSGQANTYRGEKANGQEDSRRKDQSQQKKPTPQKPKKPKFRDDHEPAEPMPVEAGHRARVSKGPFAGQVGVVQEVDSKGNARIMVGLLATRIPVDNLIGLGPQQSKK